MNGITFYAMRTFMQRIDMKKYALFFEALTLKKSDVTLTLSDWDNPFLGNGRCVKDWRSGWWVCGTRNWYPHGALEFKKGLMCFARLTWLQQWLQPPWAGWLLSMRERSVWLASLELEVVCCKLRRFSPTYSDPTPFCWVSSRSKPE